MTQRDVRRGSVMGRRTKRQIGSMSWGFTEDRLEDLGLWEPSDLDLHHVSTPLSTLSWE